MDFSDNHSIESIFKTVSSYNATLLVVSKKRTNASIIELYDMGFRQMGENRVQDLLEKKDDLPTDIQWHIIGTLQRNKVKYIADFVHMIHSVDSMKLAKEINKQASKYNRTIPVLIQVKVAEEDSKQGINPSEVLSFIKEIIDQEFKNLEIHGIMGMASFTDNIDQIQEEFKTIHSIFKTVLQAYGPNLPHFKEISMGMSGDYELALASGSTMVRLGSILFNNL